MKNAQSEAHYDAFDQANVRVDKLFYLPAATAASSLPEGLRDAIETDLFDGDNKQVISKIPALKKILTSNDEDYSDDWALECLAGSSGFLAQLARPVPTTFLGGKDTYSFSWGYYRTKWVHANDMDDLVHLAEEFSESVVSQAWSKETSKERAA